MITKELRERVKALAKSLEVKGFRKLKLKRPVWEIGQQTKRLDSATATALLGGLEALGFRLDGGRKTLDSLNKSGHLDTCTITF